MELVKEGQIQVEDFLQALREEKQKKKQADSAKKEQPEQKEGLGGPFSPRVKRDTKRKGETGTFDDPEEVHKREKRWLFDLFGLAMDGVNMYLDHKSRQKVEKGIEELKKRMGTMEGRMINLENEMLSIAEAAFQDIERIMGILEHVQEELQFIYYTLNNVQFRMEVMEIQIEDLEKCFVFVTGMFTGMLDYQEREINLLLHLITEMNHILDAIDNLSNGYLSHSVVAPYILAKLIQMVRETLIILYPEFELVINEVHEYYNIPIGSFTYRNGILAIQVPLLIKPKLQEPLMLYQLKTIPVPYHMNLDMVDASESKSTYTKLEMEKPLLAMSKDTYIGLQDQDLKKCMVIGKMYYCRDLFLMRHKHFHTCGSAIYFRQSSEKIRELCNFQYYPYLDPSPELLDEGNRILLSGLPDGWTYYCSHDDQIPTSVKSGDYVIVQKSDLCRCSISAGQWYIQENMVYCTGELDTEFNFYYTSNMAVMIHLFEQQIEEMNITDVSLYKKPLEIDPDEPEILSDKSPDVYRGKLDLEKSLQLDDVRKNLRSTSSKKPKFMSKADKNSLNNEVSEWFDEGDEDHSFRFLFSSSILSIGVAIVVVILIIAYCAIKGKLHVLDNTIGRLIGLSAIAAKAGKVNACIVEQVDYHKSNMVWEVVCQDGRIWNLTCDSNYIFDSLFGFMKFVGYVILIHMLLFLLLQIYRAILRTCFSGHNLDPVRTGGLTAFSDRFKSEIILLLTNRQDNGSASRISVLLGYFLGDTSDLKAEGTLKVGDVTYEDKCVYTYIHISWTSLTLRHRSIPLALPVHVQLRFLDSVKLKIITRGFFGGTDKIEAQLYVRNIWFQIWKEVTQEPVVIMPGGLGLPDGIQLSRLPDTLAAAALKISKGRNRTNHTNGHTNGAYQDETNNDTNHINNSDYAKTYNKEIYPQRELRALANNDVYQSIESTIEEEAETKM